MIEILKLGIKAIKRSSKVKEIHGVWTVYRKKQGRYVLTSPFYNLTFLFIANHNMFEEMRPSLRELTETGQIKKLGMPENWPAERYGEVNLWIACLVEKLRTKNFPEELIERFFWFITKVPPEKHPEEVSILVDQVSQMGKVEMYRFLAESTGDEKWARKLIKSSQLNRSEIKKEFQGRNIPIIFLPPGEEEKGVLAQMCLWAYRQLKERGKESDDLLIYLQEYVEKVVIGFLQSKGIRGISIRDISESVLGYLIEKYGTPFSYGSFSEYIRRCAQRFINEEIGTEAKIGTEMLQSSMDKREFQKWQSGNIDGNLAASTKSKDSYTVKEAAQIIRCREDWLYYQLRTGKISAHLPQTIITEQTTITRNRNNTRLDKNAIEQAKKLFELKVARAKLGEKGLNGEGLAKLIADKRNTGLRAAQRWIKRRLEKGMSLPDILHESGINRKPRP